jgi:hypothetical protein
LAQLSLLQQTTQAKIILKAQLEKIRLSFLKYFQQEREGKLKKSILLEKQKKMKDKLTRELTFAETRFELAQAKEEELEKIRLELEQDKQEELEKTRLEQEQAKEEELEEIRLELAEEEELEKTSITALQKVNIS